MIPTPADPRWRALVVGPRTYVLNNLGAKMLLMRVRLMTSHQEESAIREAVAAAHQFFTKNEAMTQADLATIFGGSR